jgi:hypothetical protein|tara:strand:- start:457 stop:732 length:276 start_codon:yes stop_codon:yes gene_type:complete
MVKTVTMQLTPEQMEGILKGAELSGTLAGEPPYKQQEVEVEFTEQCKKIRTKLFWFAVDLERVTQRLGMDDTIIKDLVSEIGRIGQPTGKG